MKLEQIGFYTLSDQRAATTCVDSDLQRCELILTSRCNFNCTYCRGMLPEDKGDMAFEDALDIIKKWSDHNLKNIRFSGGEPTLWPRLINLVEMSKRHFGIKRIALSTNGSANLDYYKLLHESGVNDFSISLDSCCAATANKLAGNLNIFDKVTNNIIELSKLTYVTVGVVITDDNQGELNNIIDYAHSLGVSDIRIIPAAQVRAKHKDLMLTSVVQQYPILEYRVGNFLADKPVRGISEDDNNHCPLVLDDMAVMNGKHYPCIIYMREHGKEIGTVSGKDMSEIRRERQSWYMEHNCYQDPICRNNCLDVCVDYNNRVQELQK